MEINQDQPLQTNFDVHMYDLACEFLSVGVWDPIGRDWMNITRNIQNQKIDHQGKDKGHSYSENELVELDFQDLELTTEQQPEVDTDWTSSSDSFKHEVFDAVIESHDFTFLNFTLLNFYADWCPHCQMFGSTWSKFEKRLKKRKDILEVADGVKPNFCVLRINRVDFEEQCGYSISIPSRPCHSTGGAPRRITTLFESWGKVRSYLTTLQHWTANIGRHDTPQAKFSYDLAPMAVVIALEFKKWYDLDLCGDHRWGSLHREYHRPSRIQDGQQGVQG